MKAMLVARLTVSLSIVLAGAVWHRHSAAQPRSARPVDLRHVVELATECARRPPRSGRGRAGTPIVEDGAVVMVPASGGRTWTVLLPERGAGAGPSGVELSIDPVHDRCDGAPIAVAASANEPPIDVDALLSTARACAEQPPYDGRGAGGSELRLDRPTITWDRRQGRSFVVRFPERELRQLPDGLELRVSPDLARCERVVMD